MQIRVLLVVPLLRLNPTFSATCVWVNYISFRYFLKLSLPYLYIESWLQPLSNIPNICAHYGRLYNKHLTFEPRLLGQMIEYYKKPIEEIRTMSIREWLEYLDSLRYKPQTVQNYMG